MYSEKLYNFLLMSLYWPLQALEVCSVVYGSDSAMTHYAAEQLAPQTRLWANVAIQGLACFLELNIKL